MSAANQQELNKIRNLPMVFIVGCGRSGTTLLQSLLNSHPNIVATPECFFIVMLYPHFSQIKKMERKRCFGVCRGCILYSKLCTLVIGQTETYRGITFNN